MVPVEILLPGEPLISFPGFFSMSLLLGEVPCFFLSVFPSLPEMFDFRPRKNIFILFGPRTCLQKHGHLSCLQGACGAAQMLSGSASSVIEDLLA